MATIPSLALLPSGYKASKVYSVLPTDGTGDFDFTRSGSATRVNSEGLIELVSTNVPRLNYPLIDGVVQGCPSLLLEPQRINLVEYSEAFDNAYWTKSASSVVSGFTSPSADSPLGAFKLVEDTVNNTHQIQRSFSFLNQKYSLSAFLKADERNWIKVNLYDGSSSVYAYFDLTNGVVGQELGANGKIENYGNGWYRCSMSTTSVVSLGSGNIGFRLAEFDGGTGYTGDGTSGIYIFGAQLEAESYATSYIPNFGTALGVTRSAETCNNAGDVNTFNDSEGVLMAEISALADDLTNRFIALTDTTANNSVSLFYGGGSSNFIRCEIKSNNITQAELTTTNYQITNYNKVAIKYKENNFALWINGTEVSTDISGSVPIGLNDLSFDRANILTFYGNTKQIQYFPTALTDSELQALTTL